MSRRSLLLVFVLVGCGVDLKIAPGTEVQCAETGDCPLGLACNLAFQRCVAPADAGALLITQVAATSSFRVVVVFNKPLSRTLASRPETYVIRPGIVVEQVSVGDDGRTVTLFTSELKGRTYELNVTGLTDIFGYVIADDDASASFLGIGDVVAPTPPKLLAPLDKTNLAAAAEVTLAWTPVGNAEAYFVTVAYDSSLATLHPSAPAEGYFTTSAPSLTLAVAAEHAYFWKVTSDANDGDSTVGRFSTVTNEVFVYCAPGNNCAPADFAEWEAGTREHPFLSPARGVVAASSFGATTVNVAGRSPDTYGDSVVIRGDVNLLGGWDPTFTSRDTRLHTTTLDAIPLALGVFDNLAAVLVDGFTVQGRAGGAALLLANCDDRVVVANSVVASEGVGTALMIDTSAGAGPLIRDSEVTGHVSVIGTASTRFQRDIFFGSDATTLDFVGGAGGVIEGSILAGIGVTLQARDTCPSLRVANNVISTFRNPALAFTNLVCGAVTVANNLVWSGSSSTSDVEATGIFIVGAGTSTPQVNLVHNTVIVAGSLSSVAVWVGQEATVSATNNMFACLSSAQSTGVFVTGSALRLLSVENNAFVGCSNAIAYESGGGSLFAYAIEAEIHALDHSGVPAARYRDNVVLALPVEQVVLDLGGSDGLVDTLTIAGKLDDDWRLALVASDQAAYPEQLRLVTGGKDTSAVTCGSYDVPVSCGDVTIDVASTPRTNPTAIGAYERDP